MKIYFKAKVWWCRTLIPVLRRQRRVDFCDLQSKFQDRQGFTEKPCLEKKQFFFFKKSILKYPIYLYMCGRLCMQTMAHVCKSEENLGDSVSLLTWVLRIPLYQAWSWWQALLPRAISLALHTIFMKKIPQQQQVDQRQFHMMYTDLASTHWVSFPCELFHVCEGMWKP